ncbi:hypothetical protein C0995_003054 [Termitomyces sp. Mi166|nr:hypothetical protein C0995_003054 [Termitomyces sp. Mi166\
MKPSPKKKEKRNITGLQNQSKAHTAMTETGSEASKSPPGRELDSTALLKFPLLELDDKENPDKDWNPEVHFDSIKPCQELKGEESDEDEDDEELEDLEDLMYFCDKEAYSRMVKMAIMLRDNPCNVDWVAKMPQARRKTGMKMTIKPETIPELFNISQYPPPDIPIHEETPKSLIFTYEASTESPTSAPTVFIQQESITALPLQFDNVDLINLLASNLETSGQADEMSCQNWKEDINETIMQKKWEIHSWNELRHQIMKDLKNHHKPLLLQLLSVL